MFCNSAHSHIFSDLASKEKGTRIDLSTKFKVSVFKTVTRKACQLANPYQFQYQLQRLDGLEGFPGPSSKM